VETVIYHNPRCSKSRATLQLLQERQRKPVVIEYLDDPPDSKTLKNILSMLSMQPRDLMRQMENVYTELGLADSGLSDDELIAAMIANPILIERPIVVANGTARIGRPPEKILEILE